MLKSEFVIGLISIIIFIIIISLTGIKCSTNDDWKTKDKSKRREENQDLCDKLGGSWTQYYDENGWHSYSSCSYPLIKSFTKGCKPCPIQSMNISK